jgi:hypothetical protein
LVDSFWRDAWTSFKAVFGPILTGAAFVLALLGPTYAPAASVSLSLIWLAIVGLILLTVLLTAGNLVLVARRYARGRLPKVLHVSVPAGPSDGIERPLTLLRDRSDLFGISILVTIYYVEHLGLRRGEVFERQIGFGRVSNIQQDGRVQVLVLAELSTHAELWQRVRNREAPTLSQIVVKPSISLDEVGIEVGFNE